MCDTGVVNEEFLEYCVNQITQGTVTGSRRMLIVLVVMLLFWGVSFGIVDSVMKVDLCMY